MFYINWKLLEKLKYTEDQDDTSWFCSDPQPFYFHVGLEDVSGHYRKIQGMKGVVKFGSHCDNSCQD